MLNPGPTNVNESVRRAMLAPDMCHRDSEFADTLKRVCQKLIRVANGADRYDVVPFVASGTGVNEAMMSIVRGRMLALVAGRYSERLYLIAQRLRVDVIRLDFDPYQGIDVSRVAEVLAADSSISHFCLVHHETTTGVMAPLTALGELAALHNVQMFVDGVSSIGGHDFDLCRDNVAAATLSANKCLESLPGISFLYAKKTLLAESKGRSCSFYFDVYEQWQRCSSTGRPPFTAAIPLFFAAEVALDRLLVETVLGRARRYRGLKRYLEQGLQGLGYRLVPLPEGQSSNILTLAYLPVGCEYERLHSLLAQQGITIYTDEATLRKGIIFFATLGDMHEKDVDRFLVALSECTAASLQGQSAF
ncbi:aminotransferase class V-fold PLP-dependent enzyme [Chitiniphilus purpureus]|uniref:Aminotransferase class V-fold PLP-dependent enzyme n=1 Tax=Chitiniphilus purpureus TaxID=2981137 RepID=A0ABY6DQP9_9NEIS|nr:aminotransferase class V-fold PLP-dependent enzyme [Chitiniphilus sp. CD1]UXY15806.1 aminotransferase class V-fold PLP-dependent enzyme [Chitiniphilus sp. CD1]